MLLSAAGAAAAAAACGWATPAVSRGATYYYTGGPSGTGSTVFTSTASNFNTVDGTTTGAGTAAPPSGSALVFDSTANASSYIGGTSSTSDAIALNLNANYASLQFGNTSGTTTPQLPTTLYIDDTLTAGTTAYTLTLSGDGTGTAGAADLIALTNAVTSTVDFRGANGSSGGELLKVNLSSSGNFNVANASAVLEVDAPIGNTSAGAFGFTKTGAGTLFLSGHTTSATENTYAGGTTVLGGVLQIDNTYELGPGLGANLSGGALRQTAALTTGRSFNMGAAGGTILVSSGVTFTLSGSAALTGPGSLTVGNATTTSTTGVADTGNLTVTGSASFAGSLTVNAGSFTFNSGNINYGGSTVVNRSTVYLDPAGTTPVGTALTLNAAAFTVVANRTSDATVAGTAFTGGVSTITVGAFNANNGSNNLNLGSLSRTSPATVDLTLPSVGGVTTTSANANGGGIIGGYFTANGGSTWATSAGTGTAAGAVTALSTFTTDFTANSATTDFDVNANNTGGTFSGSAVNSLRFSAGGATATTSGPLVVTSGGILANPSVTGTAATLTGGTLTSGNGTDLIALGYGSAPLVIASQIIDNGGTPIGLTKAGTGTIVLDASNTYTGATLITAGTLQVGNGDTNGTLGTAKAVTDNGVLAFNRSDGSTASGVISGTGSLVQNGTGTLTLAAANTFTGGLTVNAGTVAFSSTNYLSQAAGTIAVNNTGALQYTGTGGFILNATKPIALGTGTGTINISSGTGLLETLGTISGSGTLVKAGPGTLNLAAVATFTGGLTVNAGTVSVTSTSYLEGQASSGLYTTTVNDGGQVRFLNTVTGIPARTFVVGGGADQFNEASGAIATIQGPISGSGTLVQNGPGTLSLVPLTLGGFFSSSTYTGGTTIAGGTLVAQLAASLGTGPVTINAATLESFNTVDATVGYTIVLNNAVNLNDPASTINTAPAGSGAENLALYGVISGTGTLNKAGTQTVYLNNNASNYSGGTVITAGILRANNGATATGSATGTGTVTVSTAGTLGGTGVISGGVIVNGTITAGNSTTAVGTLTTGGETWNGSGGFLSKFTGSTPATGTFDRLVMSSLVVNATPANPFTVTLSNTSTGVAATATTSVVLADDTDPTAANPFNVSGGTTFASLAALQAALVLSPGTAITAPTGSSLQLDAAADGTGGYDLLLDVASAPEPTSLLLLGTVVAPLALGRRRRTADAATA